jgi:hypothetical protein
MNTEGYGSAGLGADDMKPRPCTADRAEFITAEGCSEGNGPEPQISQMAQMQATIRIGNAEVDPNLWIRLRELGLVLCALCDPNQLSFRR